MRLGEGGSGYLLCRSREISGRKNRSQQRGDSGEVSSGKPRGVTGKALSGFLPVYSRFLPTPLSQISQISQISSSATLNPKAAVTGDKLEAMPAMATSSTPVLPQDDGLWIFLRNRGVPEESIQKMQQDHIDSSVIDEIEDATMASYIPAYGGPFLGDLDDTLIHEPILTIEEDQITPPTYTSTPIDETASARPASPASELLHVTVKLHRVTLLDELIAQFKDEAMMTYSVKYSFIDEMGADADGVSRDVYAAFWTEFLDCAAEGADVRVPSLSPKWQEEEWKSVGRILAKGLKDQGYFPFRLAQAFTAAVIFGEHSVLPDLLFDSLMLYLGQSERDLLSTALQEAVVGDDEEELLDLMDRMGVRTVPTPDNLKAVLVQVAHKQMIQHPKYALDNIAEVAGPILRKFFPSVQDMKKLYEDIKPTTRKMIKMITASPANSAENQSLRFLHQYIRGLDEIGLRKLMRFLTGSDIICVKEITVTFTSLEGLARRPIAHTCGPTVELPSTYNSYPELRAEMKAILSSNTYVMDIA
ncbi:hypothetical protein PAMA_002936 [Pampus argenteus]